MGQIRGIVNGNGTKARGSGFNVIYVSAGQYQIDFQPDLPSAPYVITSPYMHEHTSSPAPTDNVFTVVKATGNSFTVYSRDVESSDDKPDAQNAGFSFVAFY